MCIYVSVCLCMYMCMSVYMCICICICTLVIYLLTYPYSYSYYSLLLCLYRNIPDLGIDVTTRMIQLTTQQLGRDHPQTLMCKNTLANFYYDSKEYDQAEEVYLDIIEDANMLMGTKNLQTLQYIFNLGVLYCSMGSMLNTGLQKIDFCIEEGNRMLMISASSKEFIGSSKNNEEAAVDVALQRELAKWVATRESYNKTDKCIIM